MKGGTVNTEGVEMRTSFTEPETGREFTQTEKRRRHHSHIGTDRGTVHTVGEQIRASFMLRV